MLIPWLEELEQNNSISKEAAAAIYKDCSDLVESSLEKAAEDKVPTPQYLTAQDQKELFTPEELIAYTDTVGRNFSALDANAKGKELDELRAAQARDNLKAQEHGAIGAEYHLKAKRFDFVNQGVQAAMGPLGSAIEKGTRPYRIAAKAHSTGKFLDRSFAEEDIPKARARFEEILDVAPSLGQNPLEMQKMVANTLHSGLSKDDKNYLRQIQVAERNSIWDMGRINTTMLKAREGGMKSSLKKALKKSATIRADHLATVFEVIHEGIGKTAAPVPTLGNVSANALKTLALVSSVPLIAGGLSGVARTVMDYKKKNDLDKSLKASYEHAMGGKDDASRELRENRDKSQSAFESLVHFAPDVATQKGAAKAFLYKMISVGGPDVGITSGDIKDLTDIQKNLTNSKGDHPFVAGFSAAGKLTGLSNITSSTISDTAKPFTQQSAEMAEAHLAGSGFGNS